ncbi:transposable element Tc1 transposase [Trichonephila clavipes]|nr:transposable element Tc1 transposase [Trichonephila clavipes]
MPPRRNKEEFQQLTEFERGRIIDLQEAGARVQWNSSAVMQVWKQWTDEHRNTRKTANHRRLRLKWALKHRAWKADWQQIVFSDESRFNLWNPDGGIHVRR